MLRTVVLVLLAASIATGCLTADVGVEVGKDGSGSVVVEVYPGPAFRERLRQLDLEELERRSRSDGATVEISEIGTVGNRGYRIEASFDDVRALNSTGEAGVRVAGVDFRLFNAFTLNEIDGEWTLAAELRPLGEVAGLLRQLLGLGASADTPELDVAVTLPGRVVRSNADEQEGGTARWQFDFSGPGNPTSSPVRLDMRTEPVPLVTPAQWAMLGAAGVVLLGMVLVVAGSRRSSRTRIRGRRRRRARGADGDPSGWAKQPFDAPKQDQAVVAPPLPWQTYKPGQEPAGAVPPPPSAAFPGAATSAPAAATTAIPAAPASSTAPSGPPAAAPVPPGWYQDPADPSRRRWWDGTAWSDHTEPSS